MFSWIKTILVHMDHCRALGCRIGVTVNMGEVDVAQLKQSWPWYYAKAQGDWFAPHQPAGGHQLSGGGGTRGPPRTRWTTSTRPGLRRAWGDDRRVMERSKRGIGGGELDTPFWQLQVPASACGSQKWQFRGSCCFISACACSFNAVRQFTFQSWSVTNFFSHYNQ